jgi:Uma2 family endonuclease
MADTAITAGQMTLEAFIRLYETEGPFEILDGEIVKQMPPVSGHGDIVRKILFALIPFDQAGKGRVYIEVPFVLEYTPNWVKGSRLPDILYYEASRFEHYKTETPDCKEKPFILIPDLVVEVISSNDKYSEINHKVDLYLQDGVQTVWVVDPKNQRVNVHHADGIYPLYADDTLDGGTVIPGLDFE